MKAIKTYLTRSQASDLLKEALLNDDDNLGECIKENDARKSEPHFLEMLEDLLVNDPAHFSVLSKGCQAAMILTLIEERGITWAETL